MPIKLVLNHREVIGNPVLNIILTVLSVIALAVVFVGVMILIIPVLWFMLLSVMLAVVVLLLALVKFNPRTRRFTVRQSQIERDRNQH